MRKFERKARLKAMKRAAKEAKRAQRAAEASAGPVPEDAAVVSEVALTPEHAAGEASALPDAGEASAPQASTLDQVAAKAAEKLEIARATAATEQDAPDWISDSEGKAMLARAARMLDSVVVMTRAALADVPLPRLREAYEIVRAKPDANGTPAQQRPRRGYDPVVSLLKTALAAASLLNRILAKTNPSL